MPNQYISIVIPTYNRSKMLIGTLDSILVQSIPNWKCIVVDDFSTDGTKSLVESYSRCDSRISYVLNSRKKGAQGARNTGILECDSDWVLLLDSDNQIEKNYIEQILDYIYDHKNVDVVTNYIKIENEGMRNLVGNDANDWITEGNILKKLLSGDTYVDNSSACIRKSKLLEIGLLDEDCPSYQEWDTHIRLAQCSEYGYVPKRLTIYKEHSGERVSSGIKSIWANGLYVLKKHRKVWLRETSKDVYCHYLVEVFEKSEGNPFWYRTKLFFVIIFLCPKLLKQYAKRIIHNC